MHVPKERISKWKKCTANNRKLKEKKGEQMEGEVVWIKYRENKCQNFT